MPTGVKKFSMRAYGQEQKKRRVALLRTTLIYRITKPAKPILAIFRADTTPPTF
jgi:hypothetical protein